MLSLYADPSMNLCINSGEVGIIDTISVYRWKSIAYKRLGIYPTMIGISGART